MAQRSAAQRSLREMSGMITTIVHTNSDAFKIERNPTKMGKIPVWYASTPVSLPDWHSFRWWRLCAHTWHFLQKRFYSIWDKNLSGCRRCWCRNAHFLHSTLIRHFSFGVKKKVHMHAETIEGPQKKTMETTNFSCMQHFLLLLLLHCFDSW